MSYNRVHAASVLDAFAGNGALNGAIEELIIIFSNAVHGVAGLGRRFAIARKRGQASRELAALDDRILADIGIQRGNIRETVEAMIR